MHSGAESLKHTKPAKRPLEAIDPDPPPASKHHRLKPPPIPSPTALPTYVQPYKRRLSHKQPSKASRPLKRVCEETDSAPANKRKVLNWLSTIESVTAPPEVTSSKTFGTVDEPSPPHTSSHTLQAVMDRISQQGQNSGASSIGSSQSETPSTSNPIFRSILSRNHVTIDPSGREMSPEVRGLVETYILKRRLSPRLEVEEKSKVVGQVLKVWDKSEPTVLDIIKSLAFPVDRRGIAEGRNTQWSTKPLPRNASYLYPLPAPKPGRHYGYPTGQDSDWTDSEIAVADHHAARPYTQPTEENILPFFVVEVKSEATGSTLYEAESQAAISGAHSVHALLWLRGQANPSTRPTSTDSAVFSATVSQRAAVFHVHWYSPEKDKVYMSHIDSLAFMKDSDIQRCCDLVKSILDYGLNIRQPIVREVLGSLNPIPTHWKRGRTVSSGANTDDSFIGDDGRASKG